MATTCNQGNHMQPMQLHAAKATACNQGNRMLARQPYATKAITCSRGNHMQRRQPYATKATTVHSVALLVAMYSRCVLTTSRSARRGMTQYDMRPHDNGAHCNVVYAVHGEKCEGKVPQHRPPSWRPSARLLQSAWLA